MAKNEAEGRVLDKVREVEREQGSFAEAGSEPPLGVTRSPTTRITGLSRN